MKKSMVVLITCILSISIAMTSFAGQWKEENGWKYQQDDGSYIISNWYEGSDGNLYYFNAEGTLCTGWYQIGDTWYYATESGALVKDNWIEYKENYYYLQSDGSMAVNTFIGGYRIESDGRRVSDMTNYEIKRSATVVSSQKRSGDIIPPGEYLVYPATDVKHVKIVDGSECITDDHYFVELFEGDTVEVSGIYTPIDNVTELDITSSGMFRVGKDVAEGTYSVNPPPKNDKHVNIAICTVFNSIPSSKDGEKPERNIVSEEYISYKSKEITVENGQYLQLINCTADLKRP